MFGLNMMTRSHKIAQAAATGRSEPHTSIPVTARSQAKGPKGRGDGLRANGAMGSGRGVVQAAAVRSMPGNSDVGLTTAQPNQVVLYESEDEVLGAPESAILT